MNKNKISELLDRRVVLQHEPTPIRRLHHISASLNKEVFCKDDSHISAIYGGSKVRKLEFIFQDALAKRAKKLVTVGSWASHHVLATALFSKGLNLKLDAVVLPQPHSELVDHAMHHAMSAGANLSPASSELIAALKILKIMTLASIKGERPYFINLGGSSAYGVLGSVLGAFELLEQVDANMAPKEGAIYVALGSGSTAAGLALGLVLANRPRPIKAIQVTSSLVVNRFVLNRLLMAGAKLLVEPEQQKELVSKAAQLIEIDEQMLGRGYGYPTSQSAIAMDEAQLDELLLDPIYTSKVFAAIQQSPQDGLPVLYWHTESFPLAAIDSNLSLPQWYRKAKLKAVPSLSKS